MSRLKVYHNGDWEYADRTSEGGGVTPDIIVSGTYSYADEYPNQADLLGATFTTTKTLAELLDKVESEGEITIGGFLTRDEDYMTLPSSLKHYAKLKVLASAVASEALVSAMSQMLPGLVANTKGLLLRVGNTNNGGVTSANIGLIVYQASSGVAFLAQNQL